VKEPDHLLAHAGPLTSRFSPAVTILNSPQFHAQSVAADLARRKGAFNSLTYTLISLITSPAGRLYWQTRFPMSSGGHAEADGRRQVRLTSRSTVRLAM
jgi:hypothetical protein